MSDQQSASKRARKLARLPIASLLAAAVMVAASSVGSAASTAAPSSWTVASTPSQTGPLNGVSCPNSTYCVAVGEILITDSEYTRPQIVTWNGPTWSLTPAPKKDTDSALASVSCVSASYCVAVGRYDAGTPGYYRTLTETWNGATWSVVASPNKTSEDNALTGVSCTSASNCVAVGYYSYAHDTPLALIESWNGSTWSIVAAPARSNDSYLFGVTCTSSSSCVAVGQYETSSEYVKTLVETRNGSDWSVVPSPNGGTSSPEVGSGLDSVSCFDATHCVAVGGYSPNGNETVSLTESWNGSTWSLMPSPNPPVSGYLEGVSCIHAAECVAVGAAVPGGASLIETLNGSAWSSTPTPPNGEESLNGVSCVKSGPCVAVFAGGVETGPA